MPVANAIDAAADGLGFHSRAIHQRRQRGVKKVDFEGYIWPAKTTLNLRIARQVRLYATKKK